MRKDETKLVSILILLICIELFTIAFLVSFYFLDMPLNYSIFSGIVFTLVTLFLSAFVYTIFKE